MDIVGYGWTPEDHYAKIMGGNGHSLSYGGFSEPIYVLYIRITRYFKNITLFH